MLDWEWYDDINTCRLFMHLLLSASYKDTKYRGAVIPKGSLKTGRILLSIQTGLSQRQVRTSLDKLKSTNEVTIKSNSKYSIISITNWDKYQDTDQQNDQRVTSQRPTSDQPATTFNKETIKQLNKENKDQETTAPKIKKRFSKPDIEDVLLYAAEKNLNLNGFYDYYESNGWQVGRAKMKDWKAAARGWSSRQYSQPNNKQKTGELIRHERIAPDDFDATPLNAEFKVL